MSSVKYHLFGDSQIWAIYHKDIQKYQLMAASAMGLNNPKSVSGYQKKFLKYSKRRLIFLASKLLEGTSINRYRQWGQLGIRAQLINIK